MLGKLRLGGETLRPGILNLRSSPISGKTMPGIPGMLGKLSEGGETLSPGIAKLHMRTFRALGVRRYLPIDTPGVPTPSGLGT